MKIVAAKCPNCGANIDVDKDSDTTKCEFCHSKIIVNDAIAKIKIDLSANVEIKNLPKYENYVTLADRYYNELMLREAKSEYRKALELNPHNPKLIFREKICRACTMSFEKINVDLIDDAYKELQEKITNKFELSTYVKECVNALSFIINKTLNYYQTNNLNYSEVLDIHYKILMCTIKIWDFKDFVDENDKETKLMLLENYISSCHLLTQDMSYNIPNSRSEGIYRISHKQKKQYVENIRKAETERYKLLMKNRSLEKISHLNVPKTNYFSRERSYTYFVVLFIINILFEIIFVCIVNVWGIIICIGNFIFMCKKIKYVKNNSSMAKTSNIIGTTFLILATILGIINYNSTPNYAKIWKNDNMVIKINRKEAALNFFNNDTIISGKYTSSCDENNNCIISLGSYKFQYNNNNLCYIQNEQCTQYLEITNSDYSLPIKRKDDICENGETVTCSEKGYFVCSNGAEHPENVCIFEEEEKNDKNMKLIISIIFTFCLLSFIESATKRR